MLLYGLRSLTGSLSVTRRLNNQIPAPASTGWRIKSERYMFLRRSSNPTVSETISLDHCSNGSSCRRMYSGVDCRCLVPFRRYVRDRSPLLPENAPKFDVFAPPPIFSGMAPNVGTWDLVFKTTHFRSRGKVSRPAKRPRSSGAEKNTQQ